MTPVQSVAVNETTAYPISSLANAIVLPWQAPHPHLPPAPNLAYGGWRLTRLADAATRPTYVAFKEEDVEHEHPALSLVGSQTVLCKGYWPFRPTFEPRHILAGCCLYTAAWGVQFEPTQGGSDPRLLSLGLPGDLERILKLLKKGRPIRALQIPTQPGRYHHRLIAWQAEVLARYTTVETIRYTLPLQDYHGYILHFEEGLGYPLPGLHRALEQYTQNIQHLMQQVWGEAFVKVAYDIPGTPELKRADTTSRENDLQLYFSAVNQTQVMGMEDLPEVALSHEVARRSGVLIPCAVCVLEVPDPYLARDDASYACQRVTLAEFR